MIREMKRFALICYFMLISGSVVQGLDYDYSATAECLVEPWSAHYGGGILANPTFDQGTEGWTTYGQSNIRVGMTKGGNKFVVAFDRKNPHDSFSQRVELEEGHIYAFSAWVQVNEGNATLSVIFRNPNGEMIYGGGVMAEHGCWKMLKGGIVSNFSGPADMILKSNNTMVEIWADNVALQNFTEEQWRSHQEISIQKMRKSTVKLHLTYNKTGVNGAMIKLRHAKPHFKVGTEINPAILPNTAYQNWVSSRFSVVTFRNEMKWYSTESVQGHEDYTKADAMMQFAEQHKIAVRGHNVLWDDPKYQPYWVYKLSPGQLQIAVQKRINSVVSRYKGRLIHWDVVNENVHFRFFEDKLGNDISSTTYKTAHQLDPAATMFMNEYNTIEEKGDNGATPDKYLAKLRSIVSYPGNRNLPAGIGLQARFASPQPNLAYMRAGMDTLATAKYPLWLTELFVDQNPNQAKNLEQVLWEGYAHPAVHGIVMWPNCPLVDECKMCLTDKEYKNTPLGNVVDWLMKKWGDAKDSEIMIECDGSCSVSLSHGEYEGIVWHPETNLTTTWNMKVEPNNAQSSFHIELDPTF